ncbi:unnamed protein product [Cylindrotheca closterium]|uniref:Uncharacterized protein n=1 Tax=Cylindrotheca closterium TaxID=2856 RepID=A0AAD2PVM0_9STRA|nr:unnamed protein product [Cylindrotheca closterium]
MAIQRQHPKVPSVIFCAIEPSDNTASIDDSFRSQDVPPTVPRRKQSIGDAPPPTMPQRRRDSAPALPQRKQFQEESSTLSGYIHPNGQTAKLALSMFNKISTAGSQKQGGGYRRTTTMARSQQWRSNSHRAMLQRI